MNLPKYDMVVDNQSETKCPHCNGDIAISFLINEETSESALICGKHRAEIDGKLREFMLSGGES